MLNINPRTLGIYAALILLIFSIGVPLIGRELQENRGADTQPDAARKLLTDRDMNIPDYSYNLTPGTKQAETDTSGQDAPASETSVNEAAPAGTAADVVPAQEKPASETGPKPAAETVPAPAKPDTAIPAQAPAADPIAEALANLDISQVTWPLEGEIIKGIGLTYSATFHDYRFHNGFDIRGADGAEAVAVLPGEIISVSTTQSEKVSLVIDHGGGWQSAYAHLSEARVSAEDKVSAGQVLGTIGQPGLTEIADGPHLHYCLTKDGQTVNPLEYLP